LDFVSFDYRRDQSGKALVDFGAARGVAHLDAYAFAPNQAGVPECLEVLREG
jgi:hypothetical protein